ncbi:MAG: SLBB domain-containing protein [Hydrogenophilales bacterium]|nr:SLBB domain-containing protein [Hydrogenophilales bacterium]
MVFKPGGYPFQLGMNVQKAVSIAGGFKERASLNKIYVIRHGADNNAKEKADLTTPILQGDIIMVEESFF